MPSGDAAALNDVAVIMSQDLTVNVVIVSRDVVILASSQALTVSSGNDVVLSDVAVILISSQALAMSSGDAGIVLSEVPVILVSSQDLIVYGPAMLLLC